MADSIFRTLLKAAPEAIAPYLVEISMTHRQQIDAGITATVPFAIGICVKLCFA